MHVTSIKQIHCKHMRLSLTKRISVISWLRSRQISVKKQATTGNVCRSLEIYQTEIVMTVNYELMHRYFCAYIKCYHLNGSKRNGTVIVLNTVI